MNCKNSKLTAVAAALVIALAFAATASAQVFTGRVDVTVEDSTGGRLPGVNVDLTGPTNQTQVTDAQGPGALPEPAGRHVHREGEPLRVQHVHELERAGGDRRRDAARRSRWPWRARRKRSP